MNIRQIVLQQLERFVDQGPEAVEAVILNRNGQKRYILATEFEAGQVTISFDDFDRYSLALHSLEVSHNVADDEAFDLEAQARHIVDQVTYLEETLTLIEIDEAAKMAQVRSETPTELDGTISYWEAVIAGDTKPVTTLSRYEWEAEQSERAIVAHPITLGTIARIAGDLAGSVEQE